MAHEDGEHGAGEGEAVDVGPVLGVIDGAGVHRPGLRPFVAGDGRAREAALRSVDVRRARRAARRAASEDVAAELRSLVRSHERDSLGPVAAAAALDMIGRVTRGEQAVRDPADWVRVLVDVARLEAGEPTSAAVVAHVGADAAARVLELRSRARAALGAGEASAAALAADDAAVPVPGADGEAGAPT